MTARLAAESIRTHAGRAPGRLLGSCIIMPTTSRRMAVLCKRPSRNSFSTQFSYGASERDALEDDALLAPPAPSRRPHPKGKGDVQQGCVQGSPVGSMWRVAWTQRSTQALRPSWRADGGEGSAPAAANETRPEQSSPQVLSGAQEKAKWRVRPPSPQSEGPWPWGDQMAGWRRGPTQTHLAVEEAGGQGG